MVLEASREENTSPKGQWCNHTHGWQIKEEDNVPRLHQIYSCTKNNHKYMIYIYI